MNCTLSILRKPGTRRSLAGVLGLLLVLGMLAMLAVPAGALPVPGHLFYGNVSVDGAPAAEGTSVSAEIGGVTYRTGAVDGLGRYGYNPDFMVPHDDVETSPAKEGGVQGDTIDFFVNGIYAASYTFFLPVEGGIGYENLTNLDLSVTTGGGPVMYDLTVTSVGCCDVAVGSLGTVTAGTTDIFSVEEGTNVDLTAQAGACCQFDGWDVDGGAVAGNPITVTMDADHTAVVTCTPLGPYTLAASANPAEGGTVDGSGEYACGETATLTANAADGWTFIDWSGDLGGAANPANLLMDGNKSVTANFTKDPFVLTVTSVGCCDVTVGSLGTVTAGTTDTFNVEEGTNVELTAQAGACCQFDGWEVDGGAVAGNPITVAVNADCTAVVTCTPLGPYTLTTAANPPEGGTVDGGGDYDCGQTATVTANAADGWFFIGWTGDLAGSDNPADLLMDGNKSVTANFTQSPYVLTVTSDGCCDITVEGQGTVPAGTTDIFTLEAGTTVNLTAVNGACCEFQGWTVDGGAVGGNPITVVMNSNHTAVAACVPLGPFTLTTAADPVEGGAVDGGGSYACGQTATLTVTVAEGWIFTGWTGDLDGSDNPAALLMDGNKTVTATFEEEPTVTYTLTVTSSEGGSVVAPGEGDYQFAEGTVVPLLAGADGNCLFTGWEGDVADPAEAATTVLMDGDKTVNATFTCFVPVVELPIVEGWNTFSVPISLHPVMDTWGEFVAFNGLDIIIGYSYNSDIQAWEVMTSDLNLQPLDGFYIYANTEGTAAIVANPDLTLPPVKNLENGLNLVGIASLTDIDLVSCFVTVYETLDGTGYTLVLNPPINVPNDWVNNSYGRDGEVIPTLEVGKAYWIVMLYPGDYVGLTSTPLF